MHYSRYNDFNLQASVPTSPLTIVPARLDVVLHIAIEDFEVLTHVAVRNWGFVVYRSLGYLILTHIAWAAVCNKHLFLLVYTLVLSLAFRLCSSIAHRIENREVCCISQSVRCASE